MSRRRASRTSTSISVGWLFADLLLALAVLFLLSNTSKPPQVKAIVKVTATPTPTPTPIPTPRPVLVLQKQRITLQIDANGLLNNVGSAINNVKQQIRGQTILRGRAVGLAIAYGGAPTSGDIPTAQAIAAKTYDVLRSLGQERFAFENASYYDSLYRLGDDVNTITIDIYLFAQ